MNQHMTGNQDPEVPFPGIEPYTYAGRELFFGRDAEAGKLSRLMVIYRAVLLYAESGVGKSSLINSGLIPLAIAEGFRPERVRVQPKKGCEVVIERISVSSDRRPPFLPSLFASDEAHDRIVLSVEDFLDVIHRKAADVRPLLIFDQFEEWYTLFEEPSGGQALEEVRESKDKIRSTIASLINQLDLPVKVLISLREDYLAKITPLLEMCHQLRDHCHHLAPIRSDEVSAIIRGPFEKFSGKFRPEISSLLAVMIQSKFQEWMKGADIELSELQIVCTHLLESGKEGKELEEYFAGAGVQGILESYLERCLDKLDPDLRDPAMILLSYMVTSAHTRNVISREDLLKLAKDEERMHGEVARRTLEKLEQTRLVRREQRYDMYYYQIASEFLVDWICSYKEEAEKKRLEEKKEAEKKEVERQLAQERLARQAERAGQYRKWMIRLSVLLVFLAIALGLALLQRQKAEEAKEEAIVARLRAEAGALQNVDREKALLFAVHAADLSRDMRGIEDKSGKETLFRSLSFAYPLRSVRIPGGAINAAAFSPDGRLVATVRFDDVQGMWVTALWDAETTGKIRDIGEEPKAVNALTFSPDGKRIAAVLADGMVKVIDAESGREVLSIEQAGMIMGVAFSPDGGRLATSGSDGAAKVRDASSGKEILTLGGNLKAISGVAFSADGSRIAISGADGTTEIWDISGADAGKLHVSSGYTGPATAVIFSRNGRQIAVGGLARTAEIRDVDTGRLLFAFTEHYGPVMGLSYSADGQYFMTIDRAGNLRLFKTPEPLKDDYLFYMALSRISRPMTQEECQAYLQKECPETVVSLVLKARGEEQEGYHGDAIESLRKAILKLPNPFFYKDIGRLHVMQGNKNEAAKAFREFENRYGGKPKDYLWQELTRIRAFEPAKADLITSVAKELGIDLEMSSDAMVR